MLNYFYKSDIQTFLNSTTQEIIGQITLSNQFDSTLYQNKAWEGQIAILKKALKDYEGTLFFEFSIPRMGKRIDALIIIQGCVFVVEFKVGESQFNRHDIEQVWDYALDLKNFHEPSHNAFLIPILVATEAESGGVNIALSNHNDRLSDPIYANSENLRDIFDNAIDFLKDEGDSINGNKYSKGRYAPTPNIIEAALALYKTHTVENITKSDAETQNLNVTTSELSTVIDQARSQKKKIICFVTGVPGAGKTLVGLQLATSYLDKEGSSSSVYLSGNGPLVKILQEALARDRFQNEKEKGNKLKRGQARASVKTFIQNIHHYRDAYVDDPKPPFDHVAIFDEAQRAWNKEQTVKFMKQRKGLLEFDYSEPEFLISCLDRHQDWSTIVCLVGGGQEINTGEAGIQEWLNAIEEKFPHWEVYISPNLKDAEYEAQSKIEGLKEKTTVNFSSNLHLSVSMRSFRAENVSNFVKCLLDMDTKGAANYLNKFRANYPIVLTRNVSKAKRWLRTKARGSERYGLVVSSNAERLKPYAIDVKTPLDPVKWFLNDKDDVRSSFYLEQVATEFHVQGLELDWSCVTWDGDLRYSENGWKTFEFRGDHWQNIHKETRKAYLINAYRVLLTRARQGMVIVVPEGDPEDHTRKAEYYDPTFEYLKSVGLETI
jgi:DUF2075 family protein